MTFARSYMWRAGIIESYWCTFPVSCVERVKEEDEAADEDEAEEEDVAGEEQET